MPYKHKYVGPSRREITESELDILLEMIDRTRPDIKGLILLGADCGLRVQEAINVRWHDVKESKLKVEHGKGMRKRWTICTPRTYEALASMEALRIEQVGKLKRDYGNKQHKGKWRREHPDVLSPIGVFGVMDIMRTARERAGLPKDLTFHCLRHRFAMKLINTGIPIHEVADLLGHSNLQSTERYLHVGADRFIRATDAIRTPPKGNGPTGFLRIVDGG